MNVTEDDGAARKLLLDGAVFLQQHAWSGHNCNWKNGDCAVTAMVRVQEAEAGSYDPEGVKIRNHACRLLVQRIHTDAIPDGSPQQLIYYWNDNVVSGKEEVIAAMCEAARIPEGEAA